MENLKKEYTDTKNVKHKVEHSVATASDGEEAGSRERITEELVNALTRPIQPGERISA